MRQLFINDKGLRYGRAAIAIFVLGYILQLIHRLTSDGLPSTSFLFILDQLIYLVSIGLFIVWIVKKRQRSRRSRDAPTNYAAVPTKPPLKGE